MSAETYEAIRARRHELIRASRTELDEHMGKLVEAASADDLEWLLERLETQLKETPHHVKEADVLEKIQTKTRTQVIFVRGVLGNKRAVETAIQDRLTRRRANVAMFLSIASAVIAAAGAAVTHYRAVLRILSLDGE
jgi:thiamine pyrophosphate-dependent acetolactate synthase large subunit-like protein